MMTKTFDEELKKGLSELSLCISEAQRELLYDYYQMVVEKNKVMNLTAITEEREFVIKHIIDSLSIVKAGPSVTDMLMDGNAYSDGQDTETGSTARIKLIDIGTGAGMPGVILRIVFPEPEIVLFDSLKKRLSFLDEVIERLSLKHISTLHGRAEDLGQDKQYRESFDLAVSRAVARMNVLLEYGLPLVKTGGVFVPYKSGDVDEELKEAHNALGMLGGSVEDRTTFQLPDSDMSRSLIIIRKKKPTPKSFPRKAGLPSKKPIT